MQTLRDAASVHRQSAVSPTASRSRLAAPRGLQPGSDLGLHTSRQHRRRPGRGLRDQLPAAVHVPAGLLEQLRHASSTTRCRVRDRLRDVSAPGATPTPSRDDLAGLSKNAYNATLYFDNKIFSARVSAAYRSDYLTTVPGRTQRRSQDARRHDRDVEHRLLGLVQLQRQLLRVARGAEPHRRSAGPVGGYDAAIACRLPPPGSPVLPGCPLQVLVRSGTAP